MLVYLIKFSACLAILLLFYKLLLERERIHHFKRFYLIGALLFSLLVPTLVLTEQVAVYPTPHTDLVDQTTTSVQEVPSVPQKLESDILDISPILWIIYFLGIIFFGITFVKNLFQIFQRIKNNPKERKAPYTRVLLHQDLPPHTFFNYIFLNRAELQSNEIPKEVLLHEETHVRQKHSVDVLIIELVQVVFWFHPLLYLIRKSIKLNHEFLADSAVLKKGVASSTYQNTLLSYLSSDSEKKYRPLLANAINYSSIKKRFTIMKRQTSRKAIVLRSIAVLPLAVILLLGFSETKLIKQEINLIDKTSKEVLSSSTVSYQYEGKKEFILHVNANRIELNGNILALSEFAKAVDQLTKDWEETDYTSIPVRANFNNSTLAFIKKVETEFGKTHFSKANEGMKIFPADYQKTFIQKGASREQMREYNALAKKYNHMFAEKDNIHIKGEDMERLRHIYSLMSDKQKDDAEPFPDFPSMPEPPMPPTALEEVKMEAQIRIEKEVLEEQETKVEKLEKMEKQEKVMKEQLAPTPPSPPTPKSPLEHVMEMAEKDALFYYKNKRISSDEAIDILKKDMDLSLDIKKTNDELPVVRIDTHF
ncbi:MAG: M56 family metallopeptidase [Bacteroidota bacterium]